jgi:hypothetical protein
VVHKYFASGFGELLARLGLNRCWQISACELSLSVASGKLFHLR